MKKKIILILPFLLLASCQGKVTSEVAKYKGGTVMVDEITKEVSKTPIENIKTQITNEALKKVKFSVDTNKDVKKAYDDRKFEIKDSQKGNLKNLLKTYRVNDLDELLKLVHIDTTAGVDAYNLDYFKKNLMSDESLKAFYDSLVDEVQISHILIPVDETTTDEAALAEATKLTEELKAFSAEELTKKFAEYATTYSKDTQSAEKGGDVGLVGTNSQFVPEFKEAAFQLKKGDLTAAPVKTQFGYHIMLATNVVPKDKFEGNEEKFTKDFYTNEVSKKPGLPSFILTELHKNVKVEIKDETLNNEYKDFIEKSIADYNK